VLVDTSLGHQIEVPVGVRVKTNAPAQLFTLAFGTTLAAEDVTSPSRPRPGHSSCAFGEAAVATALLLAGSGLFPAFVSVAVVLVDTSLGHQIEVPVGVRVKTNAPAQLFTLAFGTTLAAEDVTSPSRPRPGHSSCAFGEAAVATALLLFLLFCLLAVPFVARPHSPVWAPFDVAQITSCRASATCASVTVSLHTSWARVKVPWPRMPCCHGWLHFVARNRTGVHHVRAPFDVAQITSCRASATCASVTVSLHTSWARKAVPWSVGITRIFSALLLALFTSFSAHF